MGKVPTAVTATTEMKRKKKKGRPSKNPLPQSTPTKPPLSASANRRSTRRNPNQLNSPPRPDFDDDEDERKEKKVKLVVRLPQSDEKIKSAEKQQKQQSGRHSHDSDSDSASESGSGYDSDPEDEDREGPTKKRKTTSFDGGSDDGGLDQDKDVKATETPLQGSPLESGPTTPLPDKKLLTFILGRLQKKDTYGVFSEPVDPEELPDYFDIIKQPMDFGTVRKKLDSGAYKNVEELEVDVLLICSNAMQYNASDTVYYKQARNIQELAKRDFKNLKHEGEDGEPQPKIVRRGRPPSSKNQKKPFETSPVDRVGTDLSSGATLANGEDKATGSNSYNLRKGSPLFRYRSTDPYVSSYGSRNGENEYSTDWNDEFPASILRADMKYGKKHFIVDENKRDTFRQFDPLSLGDNSLVLYHSIGNMKRLVPVGLQDALAYARSLARYAANLGPAAWKMASKKIEAVLPAGVQYGPGWVGENLAPSQTLSIPIEKQMSSAGDYSSSKHLTTSTSGLNSSAAHEGMVEAVRKLNRQNELAGQGDASSWRTQFPPQQNHMHHSHRNGFNGMFGYGLTSAAGTTTEHSVGEGVKVERVSINDCPNNSSAMSQVIPEQAKFAECSNAATPGYEVAQVKSCNSIREVETRSCVKSSWQGVADLNVRVPAGSPGSSLQIGSPKHPDLALQL